MGRYGGCDAWLACLLVPGFVLSNCNCDARVRAVYCNCDARALPVAMCVCVCAGFPYTDEQIAQGVVQAMRSVPETWPFVGGAVEDVVSAVPVVVAQDLSLTLPSAELLFTGRCCGLISGSDVK